MRIIAILLLSLTLFGCRNGLKIKDVAGTYVGNYGGATERLTLFEDGKLTQVLEKNGQQIYVNTARWEVRSKADEDDLIFNDFIVAVRMDNLSSVTSPDVEIAPRRFTVCDVASMGGGVITIAPATPYLWRKSAK